MPETEGEKRLKRATKLLGTDHFDKKKDEPQQSKTADPSPSPVSTPRLPPLKHLRPWRFPPLRLPLHLPCQPCSPLLR